MDQVNPDFVERFLTSYLNRAGAVVADHGYNLVEVLLPEELSGTFQSEEMMLAFEYETARENPASIYVTSGSYLLDTAVEMALEYGKYTVQYWPGQELVTPKNLEKKIAQAIAYEQCRKPLVEEIWSAENTYYIFNYLCTFRSHDKEEEHFKTVVNAYSATPCPEFEESWRKLVPLEKAQYKLGKAPLQSLERLYEVACEEIKPRVQKRAESFRKASTRLAEREQAKTNSYYEQVIAEIRARLKPTTEPEKAERLQNKLSAAQEEWKRRNEDIILRYEIEVDIRLDHLIACITPVLFINIMLQHKNSYYRHYLIYNPLLGIIETPQCSKCKQKTAILTPSSSKTLNCPNCRS